MGLKNNTTKIELLNGVLEELNNLGTPLTNYLDNTYDMTNPKSLSPSYLRETIKTSLELLNEPNNDTNSKKLKNLDNLIKGQINALYTIDTQLKSSQPEYTQVDNDSEKTLINKTTTPINYIPDELLISDTSTERPLIYKIGTGIIALGLLTFGSLTVGEKLKTTSNDIKKILEKFSFPEYTQEHNPFFDNAFWRSYLSFFEDLKQEGILTEEIDDLVQYLPENDSEIDIPDAIKDAIIEILSNPKGNLIYWDDKKYTVPYDDYTQITKKILEESDKKTDIPFVNTYSIDDNFSLILDSDYITEIVYKNKDLKKGPTGMLLKIVPKDTIEDTTNYLTKDSSKELDLAIKQSYTDEDQLTHILKKYYFRKDKSTVPPGIIFTTKRNNVVFKNLEGKEDESTYLLVGIENQCGYVKGEYNSGNAWDQLNKIEKDNSNLFPQSGSSGTLTDGKKDREDDGDDGDGGGDHRPKV
ncbi:MAG: hypothetical protein K0B07_00295 [DPANN group archaeon]|nr:hypothetical protein [DPANN group archaeon]